MESKLLKISKRDYENNDGFAHFVDNEDINSFLNIFNQYPHAFVLGCVMDKQIKAERAWEIPYKVYLELGNFEIDFLLARKNKVCPIEIKSSGYKTHSSLDAFSAKYSSRILNKYLVYTKDLGKDKDIFSIPVYMTMFL